jgi:DNA mismatch repair protein MutL
MSIQVLPDTLVARIAAGEVVERPSSAVKELIENAIDAGAKDIRIECADSGKRLIRVTDDGGGIRYDEIELAFTHHATSKLRDASDLDKIGTLGFRGEALASIASVAHVTCVSCHADETSGSLIRIDGGKLITKERIGRTPGTTITIEQLFSRVPARLKFLKSSATEKGHIDGIVMRYAMAYPHIRFTLTHEGRLHFQSLGNGNTRDVLVEVFGAEAAKQMVSIGDEQRTTSGDSSIVVSGFAALPALDHGNRSKIMLFVNGRPVQDTKLTYAVIQAYHTLLMTGRYPIAVILVQVPSEDVDVNAHPAKAEVRFRDADGVFSAVQRAVRRALLENMAPPEPPSVLGRTNGDGRTTPNDDGRITDERRTADDNRSSFAHQSPLSGSETWERIGIQKGVSSDHWGIRTEVRQERSGQSALGGEPFTSSKPQLPALRILGQLAATYIIAEGPEGLYLIDQHASHERVLFEKMLAQLELGEVISQALLDPVSVDIPADSAHLLGENLDMLRETGFDIDHFGGKTFLVRAVPHMMIQDDIAAALREIVADLEMGNSPLRKEIEAKVLRRVCKRMAIKAGRVLSFPEMQALVRDLESCESPRTCPHGRPTMIQIGVQQLEKEFGRLG